MFTVKYIIFLLFYLINIVLGHNGFRIKTSAGDLKNVNLETLLELHKDVSAGRIFNNDGTIKEPPEKNTAISKLVFLTDIINEILTEGLSDQENEVLSNIISIHGKDQKSKFNEKNMTEDLLGLVFNNMHNNSDIPDIESDDVNKGEELVENKINAYLLSDEIINNKLIPPKKRSTYFILKEKDDTKDVLPIGFNPNFKPMENKWRKLLNESLRIIEFDNKKDLKTVKPVFDDILNKKFKLHRTFERKSIKNGVTAKGFDKGYLNEWGIKLKSLSNSTKKSINIRVSKSHNESDDNDESVVIDMFDDLNANPNYRRQLKISAKKIQEYRRNAQGLKKLNEHSRRQASMHFVETDPNYDEDDYYWEPSPLLSRRIFQGIPVRITDFPFMASIHMFETLQCAGSIIKSDLIITAASCLQIAWNNRFFRENPRFLTVRVGSTRYYGGGEVIEVAEVYFHPHYKPKTLTANLAIIRLYRNLRFSNVTTRYVVKIRYDRIDHKIPDNNSPVTIIGFGAVRPSNKLHNKGFGKLQYAILPIYPIGDCKDMYTRDYVTRFHFCAGLMSTGSGACNHDVGDPGISEGVILGIVSFGSPVCGRVDTPTVFTKVGQYKSWIDEIYKIEPVVYPHRYSTTPFPVPLEPPKRTTRPHFPITPKKEAGRNLGLAKAKLSNNRYTNRPFKVRPMTKTVDVLEYFPEDDPLHMGNGKKRKLRNRPNKGIDREVQMPGQAQMPVHVPGVGSPQQNVKISAPPSIQHVTNKLPLAMQKQPFGTEEPPGSGQQQQSGVLQKQPFGMEQPLDAGHQQQSEVLQKQPFGMEQPLDAGHQQQSGVLHKQAFGMDEPLDAGHQDQSGALRKQPFGMEEPLDVGHQEQSGALQKQQFGMEQPLDAGHQQQSGALQKKPFGMEQPLDAGHYEQSGALQKQPFGMEQPLDAGHQQQSGALHKQVFGREQPLDAGQQQQSGAATQQKAGKDIAKYAAALAKVHSNGKPSGGNQQPHSTTIGSQDMARTPALALEYKQTDGTTTQSNHEFIPDDCVESDIEGTGASKCPVTTPAAAMSATHAGGIKPQGDVMFDGKMAPRVDTRVRGPKLTNANSEAIDDENKVSSLIESILAPGMQSDVRQALDADNQQDGAQKLKEIDKSIMSMLYVNDKEDKTKVDKTMEDKTKEDRSKEDKNNAENNDSSFKDYKVPRSEGLALPDQVDVIELDEPDEFKFRASDVGNDNPKSNQALVSEEPHKFRFRAADDSNENRNSNNPAEEAVGGAYNPADQAIGDDYIAADQAIGNVNNPTEQAVGDAFNPADKAIAAEGDDDGEVQGLVASEDPGATMDDVITNIPRYREDTDPPEDYLDQ